MFITIKDYFDDSKHLINSEHIVRVTDEGAEYCVIELDDCDGTFVRIDRDTYTSIKRTLERMG